MKCNKRVLALAFALTSIVQSALAFDAMAELAALKAKYPEALERCTPFEAMHKVREYQAIVAAQDKAVKAKDWAGCERLAREVIALKTELDTWYYNLACALSLQKKIPEALVALEQCVAAGYRDRAHVEKDGDMENVRGEKRYAELLEVMDLNEKNHRPLETIRVEQGRVMLTEAQTECVLEKYEEKFLARIDVDDAECPIIYMDRNHPHKASVCDALPGLNLIEVDYPEEMKKFGQDVGAANVVFIHPERVVLPVIAATDVAGTLYPGSSLSSVFSLDYPGTIAFEDVVVNGDVLQLAAAGRDYGFDGIDRYVGNNPMIFNYVGGETEQRFFVSALANTLRALPTDLRTEACTNGVLVDVMQWLVRASQRHVRETSDYLTGAAHPPAFFADQIDAERLMRMARDLKHLPPRRPMLFLKVRPEWSDPANELECDGPGVLSDAILCMTARSVTFAFRGLDRTLKVKPHDCSEKKTGKIIWKVLQGDPEKVRVATTGECFTVEVDYQPVFEIVDAHGRKVKTSRVDIGFFRELDGEYSLPYIISVAMPPHDTRTYDAQGRLAVADYTKPQIHPTNFVSRAFVRGTWRDTYHYGDDGAFLGWTRDEPEYPGSAVEWNAAYMEVVERDELGRPLRLARPRTYAWAQDKRMDERGELFYDVYANVRSILLDNARENFAPVSWVCEYTSTNDFTGEIREIPYAAFLPERWNAYAEFGLETNAFAYPLSMELEDGLDRFRLSKFGTHLTHHEIANLKREPDDRYQMAAFPKKMKFVPIERRPWGWPDISDVEYGFSTNLVRIPDGPYRYKGTNEQGRACLESVAETQRLWNDIMSVVAGRLMDESHFERCTTNELNLILTYATAETFATNCVPFVSGNDLALVHDHQCAITGWHVVRDICLVVRSDGLTESKDFPGVKNRTYSFIRLNTNDTDRIMSVVDFGFFPPDDMARTFLNAYLRQTPVSQNNFAVLLYAGAADFYQYADGNVLYFLESSARQEDPTALYNLGVFYDNRRDPQRAKMYYRLAEKAQKHAEYAELFEKSFGGTNLTAWIQFLEGELSHQREDAYVELAISVILQQNSLSEVAEGHVPGLQASLIDANLPQLITKSAEAGGLLALNLAALSAERIGITNAVKWAQAAVATGLADGDVYCELADAYCKGLGGLEKNATTAVKLLTIAAKRGHAEARQKAKELAEKLIAVKGGIRAEKASEIPKEP